MLSNTQFPLLIARPETQHQSLFFRLFPQEIRDQIFAHVFQSTRLSFGIKDVATGRKPPFTFVKPSPHSLALISACRRIRNEIGLGWVSMVLFNFLDTWTMSQVLRAVPRYIVRRIRHLRVCNDPWTPRLEDQTWFWNLLPIFQLLPGLRLDRLTVLGHQAPEINYLLLNELILYGNGWRELCYMCCNSEITTIGQKRIVNADEHDNQSCLNTKPQPSHWRALLRERDGEDSKPSITVYRSRSAATRDSNTDMSSRVVVNGSWGHKKDASHNGGRNERKLSRNECRKDIMFVVTRGYGVDYTERTLLDDPDHYEGTADIFACLSLTDIEGHHHAHERRNRNGDTWQSYFEKLFSVVHPTELDSYQDLDHFNWPWAYFPDDA